MIGPVGAFHNIRTLIAAGCSISKLSEVPRIYKYRSGKDRPAFFARARAVRAFNCSVAVTRSFVGRVSHGISRKPIGRTDVDAEREAKANTEATRARKP